MKDRYHDIYLQIGLNILRCRKERGLTQEQLQTGPATAATTSSESRPPIPRPLWPRCWTSPRHWKFLWKNCWRFQNKRTAALRQSVFYIIRSGLGVESLLPRSIPRQAIAET